MPSNKSLTQDPTKSIFNVNPVTAAVPPLVLLRLTKYHLSILRRFYDLFEVSGNLSNVGIEKFLVCAEARYIRYLQLLDTHVSTFGRQEKPFSQAMPLPPWYTFSS